VAIRRHPGSSDRPARPLNPGRLLILGLGLGVVAAGAFLVTASSSLYEVEEKGRHLLPYQTGEVYRVKVADSVTLYADGESRPSASTIQGTLLAALSTAAFMTFFFLRRARARPQVLQFYLVAGVGLAFVAFDELFALHETVGHNVRVLADLPGVERPDDVLVLLYAIPLAYCAYRFRRVITESRRAMGLFAAGIGLFLLSVLADFISASLEEAFELLSMVSILLGLVTLFRQHVAEVDRPYRRDDEIRAARLREEQPVEASRVR
jgi:hypothetical protein